MSTSSFVLLSVAAFAGLVSLWRSAGLSGGGGFRSTPRVITSAGVGLLGVTISRIGTETTDRTALLLPALFALLAVVAEVLGSAQLDGALEDGNQERALRRSQGLVSGAVLGMLALSAFSLALSAGSLRLAQLGWVCVLPPLASLAVTFAGRFELAGLGALRLGKRGFVLGALCVLALVAARLGHHDARAHRPPPGAAAHPVPAIIAAAVPAHGITVPASSTSPAVSSAPAVTAEAAPPAGVHIESIDAQGMMDADIRSGILRKFARLEACTNRDGIAKAGTLTLKILIDETGSVTSSNPTDGTLLGSPLAHCLLSAFYVMGFAAPRSGSATLIIVLSTT